MARASRSMRLAARSGGNTRIATVRFRRESDALYTSLPLPEPMGARIS